MCHHFLWPCHAMLCHVYVSHAAAVCHVLCTHLQCCQQLVVLQCSTAIVVHQEEPLLDHTLHRGRQTCICSQVGPCCRWRQELPLQSQWGGANSSIPLCSAQLQAGRLHCTQHTSRPHQHHPRELWRWQGLAMLSAPLTIHSVAQQRVDMSLWGTQQRQGEPIVAAQ